MPLPLLQTPSLLVDVDTRVHSFSPGCDKTPGRSDLGGQRGFFIPEFRSHHWGKRGNRSISPCWWELVAAGHIEVSR